MKREREREREREIQRDTERGSQGKELKRGDKGIK